jgi:putative transposase
MKPYSPDLRRRIVEALETGEDTQSAIAERFQVSLSFVEKLWHRWRSSGHWDAKPHAGGRKRALSAHQARIRAEIATQPDVTLAELCQRVAGAGGAAASKSMMCREVKRLKLPRKKNRSTIRSVRLSG